MPTRGCLTIVLGFAFISAAAGPIDRASSQSTMDRQSVVTQFETLLPLAVKWAAEQEQRILREGVPLSESEIADAKLVGVREPQCVRLLQVAAIPRPSDPQLATAADAIQFLTPATRGLTLNYGIFIRSDCGRDRLLIVHELVHTAQYEQRGGISSFLRQYLFDCITIGYPEAPMEKAARETATRVCSR
jgi:hypothetical protein